MLGLLGFQNLERSIRLCHFDMTFCLGGTSVLWIPLEMSSLETLGLGLVCLPESGYFIALNLLESYEMLWVS